MYIILSCIVVIILVVLIAYLYPRALVIGDSMLPTLEEGQKLRCSRWYVIRSIKLNNLIPLKKGVYVLRDLESDKLLIKRLLDYKYSVMECRFSYWFEGDNKDNSKDSRKFGFVSEEYIVAIVLKVK